MKKLTYEQLQNTLKTRPINSWWLVTSVERNTDKINSIVAQFEPSNSKWYKPEPFEGRSEIGYVCTIFLPNNCYGEIVNLRALL